MHLLKAGQRHIIHLENLGIFESLPLAKLVCVISYYMGLRSNRHIWYFVATGGMEGNGSNEGFAVPQQSYRDKVRS